MNGCAMPNPMRETGRVEYRVASGETVRIALYDAQGREVTELVAKATGSGVVDLPVSELASGSYTVRLIGASGVVMTTNVTIAK